jgi:hypothetical protein
LMVQKHWWSMLGSAVVSAWTKSVAIIGRNRDPIEGLSKLLAKIKRQITFP